MNTAYNIPSAPPQQVQPVYYGCVEVERYVEQLPQLPQEEFVTIIANPPFRSADADHGLPPVPPSFWIASSDFETGRVVDMDTAVNQPPPNA
jgi:hypothetical protein